MSSIEILDEISSILMSENEIASSTKYDGSLVIKDEYWEYLRLTLEDGHLHLQSVTIEEEDQMCDCCAGYCDHETDINPKTGLQIEECCCECWTDEWENTETVYKIELSNPESLNLMIKKIVDTV